MLRGKRLERPAPDAVEYTTSIKDDRVLVKPVIKINMAHTAMLAEQGIIPSATAIRILESLSALPSDLPLDPLLEDVHMNVEAAVIREVGEEVGGYLNLGKSRNDQVATAIRMALREYLLNVLSSLIDLRKTILAKCREHTETIMPGYTHLQPAQPVTLAHHLLAYHDALERSCERILQAFKRANLSAMGAAALATTTLDINRGTVAGLLGFDGFIEDSVDAVSARDFAVEAASIMAVIMTELSRLAEEVVLWSTAEFSAVQVPDAYASTSSIMPQKKNPVVAELIRAKTSTVHGSLMSMLGILKALPYSYNLDLQELTPHLWRACETTLSSLKVASSMLRGLRFNPSRLKELASVDGLTATDLAETLASKHGVPFRKAHNIVGALVKGALASGRPLEEVAGADLSSAAKEMWGKEVVLSKQELHVILNPRASVESRGAAGGPSPKEAARMLEAREKRVPKSLGQLLKAREALEEADRRLKGVIGGLKGGEKL